MTKKELMEGFSTYINMIESAKAKQLEDKDLNNRTMWGIILFLLGYSVVITATLLLKLAEYIGN